MNALEWLDKFAKLAKSATRGTFDIERRDDDCGYINYIVHGPKGDYAWCRDELDSRARHNAALIAAANADAVLTMIEALKAALPIVEDHRKAQKYGEAFGLEWATPKGMGIEAFDKIMEKLMQEVRL